MKKYIKRLLTFSVLCALIACIGLVSVNAFSANAGLEPSRAYETKFDDGALSGGSWDYLNATVVKDDGEKDGLRVENGGEGTGIITNRHIFADKVRLETDIEYLELNGGWFAFIIGADKTEAPILDWNIFSNGQYILLQYVGSNWYFITQPSGKGYDFVDENGVPTKDGDDEVSRRYNKIALGSSPTLENVTLSLSLDKDGNLVFAKRNIGEPAESETVLAKTADVKYEPYTVGRVGFCVMQGSRQVNAKFGDVRVFADEKNDPDAKFRFDNNNVAADYILDVGNNPNSLSFAAKGKLRLSAHGGRSYAICKTPVYTDENVKDYSVRNIDVSFVLYPDAGFGGNDTLYIYAGLSNPYDTELAADGTYALKIGANAFSVVKYAAGIETDIISNTAYIGGNEYTGVNFSIDGDGTMSVKVGSSVSTAAEKQNLPRRRTYLGFALSGNSAVKIDDFTVLNALYSRPNNKDISADFTDDDININEWYLPAWGGNVESRYDGVFAEGGVLRFKDVNSNASITSIPKFSNFELTFDITDIKREGYKGSPFIGIMYGLESPKTGFNVAYIAEKRPFISFRPSGSNTNYSVLNTENERSSVLPSKYNMFSPKMSGKVFSVKLTMTDGLLTLYLKTDGEKEFTEIFHIQESGAVTGCIRINGYGDGVKDECSNFSIDNLSIKNTDINPSNKNDYGYKSNKEWASWNGFEYEDTWNSSDLLPVGGVQSDGKKGCSQSAGVACGFAAVVLLGSACAMFGRKKK